MLDTCLLTWNGDFIVQYSFFTFHHWLVESQGFVQTCHEEDRQELFERRQRQEEREEERLRQAREESQLLRERQEKFEQFGMLMQTYQMSMMKELLGKSSGELLFPFILPHLKLYSSWSHSYHQWK